MNEQVAKIRFFFNFTIRNFFILLYQLVRSPFSRTARHKLAATYLVMKYPYFGNRYVDLSALLKEEELFIQLAPVKARAHNTDSFELMSVCALVKDNRAESVFEIGTYDGRTTRAIAMNVTGNNRQVFTLNLPPEAAETKLDTSIVDIQLASKVISGERFLNTPEAAYITQVWGDSAKFDFTSYYNSIDFVFIDGAHSKDYVENDTMQALKMIKSTGGIVMWHDAHLFGVVKFLEPWIKTNQLDVYFIKNTSLAVARVKNGAVTAFYN